MSKWNYVFRHFYEWIQHLKLKFLNKSIRIEPFYYGKFRSKNVLNDLRDSKKWEKLSQNFLHRFSCDRSERIGSRKPSGLTHHSEQVTTTIFRAKQRTNTVNNQTLKRLAEYRNRKQWYLLNSLIRFTS